MKEGIGDTNTATAILYDIYIFSPSTLAIKYKSEMYLLFHLLHVKKSEKSAK